MKKEALVAVLAVALAGCGQRPQFSFQSPAVKQPFCSRMSLQFLASGSLSSDLMFDGASVGGLSGIDYDTGTNQFVLITDDRGNNGGTRLFAAEIHSQLDQSLRITLRTVHQLRTSQAKSHSLTSNVIGVDAEAVRLFSRNRLLWGSEGDVITGVEPGVYLSESGKFIGQ